MKKPRNLKLRRWLSSELTTGSSVSFASELVQYGDKGQHRSLEASITIRDCSESNSLDLSGEDALEKIDILVATLQRVRRHVVKALKWKEGA